MSWRTGGIRPEKTNAGLRGIGLIAIVVAFLAVSNSYVSGRDDDPRETSQRIAGRATVLAPDALREALPAAVEAATYRFLPAAEVRRAVEDNDDADVVVTSADDVAALARDRRCAGAVAIGTAARRSYVACLPTSVDADARLGQAYLTELTSVRGRAALLEGGIDVGPR